MVPSRMPRYYVSNDGMGPYAIFYCDRCNREYRSNPNISTTVTEGVKRGAFGGLLRNVPIVGNAAANQIENDRYRTSMSNDELNSAWGQTQQYFRECPTCHQIVCIPDFDEPTGYCDEHSPNAAANAQAQAEQAAAALKGVASAFGVGNAIQASMAAHAAQAAAAMPSPCAKCGTPLAPGAKFCPNCGTPTPQPAVCKNCGAGMAAGVKFCANCGTAAA